MVEIVIVAAVGRNGVIGRAGTLPWRLPTDLRHFRDLSMGKPMIMGRRTFEGLGRPLPGRTSIVVSRDPAYAAPAGVETTVSVAAALARGRAIAARDGVEAVIVAGGAAIYRAALPYADRIELTEVALTPDGDARFPALDAAGWRETARSLPVRGENDDAAMVFITFVRLCS